MEVNSVTNVNKPQAKFSKGTKIGAGVGLAMAGVNAFMNKSMLKDTFTFASEAAGKNKAAAVMVAGFAIGAAITTGISALVGSGVEKLIVQNKKDKA